MLKILRVLPFFLIASRVNAEPPIESEVCLYGGTPAGVIAAAAAARQGHTVSLVDINAHTGGVGWRSRLAVGNSAVA
jgi:NADPH-dependent 2,4-dienoyl-CoA reductase/sulfur reductase-like enzyme